MQHLTPVGLSKDGKTLVLVSDAGEEFAVPVDHRLRTALRGDNARLGQLEMRMESTLRPRDIQARIRSGESAEDVAAAAQTTVEAIMAFAAPVLAERAHVAALALKASIRRRNNESAPAARTLDEASRQQLVQLGVRADELAWDAWRRDDGRWTLVAEYAVRGTAHRAEFSYDQPGRYVVAENTDAQVLTGEAAPATVQPAAPGRRLSAVPSEADQLPLGDDALELVHGPQEPVAEEPVAEEAEPEQPEPVEEHSETADLTSTAEAVRGKSGEFDDLAADHADADWIAELPLDQPEAPYVDEAPEPEPEPEPAAESEPAAEERPKKKGRSSVPSWDEIMFGGGTGGGGRD